MEPERHRSWETTLRMGCLLLLVVQNSSLILVTSYSRTLDPPYLPTVAVFLAEAPTRPSRSPRLLLIRPSHAQVLKAVSAFCLLGWEQRSLIVATRQTLATVHEHGWETLQFAVPALCYTLQNNLWYYALSNLDPVTAAVTSQMKVHPRTQLSCAFPCDYGISSTPAAVNR